jgi:hypothetical protein
VTCSRKRVTQVVDSFCAGYQRPARGHRQHETNAERKKAFDIRALMEAVIDSDSTPLERRAGMVDADTSVVFDAFLGRRVTRVPAPAAA